MARSDVAARWDGEYRAGRYLGEPPVGFVWDILAAVRDHGLERAPALYVGCGSGRNFLPLAEAGLALTGVDVSRAALDQLAERCPAAELVHGDLDALAAERRFGVVIGIQVLQHGSRAEADAHVREALGRLSPGGLFCVRVNAAGTQVAHRHRVVEEGDDGGLTVEYQDGPKRGLLVHFFARAELERLLREASPVMALRRERTHRAAPGFGLLGAVGGHLARARRLTIPATLHRRGATRSVSSTRRACAILAAGARRPARRKAAKRRPCWANCAAPPLPLKHSTIPVRTGRLRAVNRAGREGKRASGVGRAHSSTTSATSRAENA